jgi:hypothetical protein
MNLDALNTMPPIPREAVTFSLRQMLEWQQKNALFTKKNAALLAEHNTGDENSEMALAFRTIGRVLESSQLVVWKPELFWLMLGDWGESAVATFPDFCVPRRPEYHVLNPQVAAPFEKKGELVGVNAVLVFPSLHDVFIVAFMIKPDSDSYFNGLQHVEHIRAGERLENGSFAQLWVGMSLFMKQKVQTESVPVAKKLRRGLNLRHVPDVRRVILRASLPQQPTPKEITGPESFPGSVEWSCQWNVKGHWRNQYYPSTGEHKRIFVAEYRKGPQDKPLRDTPVVVEVKR